MTFSDRLIADYRKRNRNAELRQLLLPGTAVAAASVVIAYLVVTENWIIALGLLGALPAVIVLHKYPFVGLLLWLLFTPFLVAIEGGTIRKVYWVIHRALPPLVIGIICLTTWLGLYKNKLPKLGWPEYAMVGYLLCSQLSILYLNNSVTATTFQLYDRVFIPMCLYLLVRLTKPGEKEIQLLLPVIIFILVSQSIIGILSWIAPEVLPSAWQNRVGVRTTGSLRSYSVFSSTVIFLGALLLHRAISKTHRNKVRLMFIFLFVLSLIMVFLSFSRGSWLAGLLVFLGLLCIYPKPMFKLTAFAMPILIIGLSIGFLSSYTEWAGQRFYSDQSEEEALSRLPIIYASLLMFEEKPLLGWGFGNFDRYDRQFQARVGDIYSPTKDHASHNVYLTILAEQGLVGLFLFFFPVFWWLKLSIQSFSRIPSDGFWSKKFLIVLWLVILFHFVVNNFSNMRVVFGLGMWWIALSLIAIVLQPYLAENGRFLTPETTDHLQKGWLININMEKGYE